MPGAKDLGECIRAHWGIENSLHWVVGMTFQEVECRIRTGFAAQNMGPVRKIAINVLKNDNSTKASITANRTRAG